MVNYLRLGRTQRETRGRVMQRHRKRGRNSDVRLTWGAGILPRKAETAHFAVVGTTGSGKTLTIERMMRETLLPDIGVVPDQRALIFDEKQEVMSFLSGLDLRCPVVTLNPFDARGAEWDIGIDINSPAAARQLARILITDDGQGDKFFVLGPRDVLTEVVMGLIRFKPRTWTLKDLVLATRSRRAIERLLSMTASGRDIFESYFGDDRTGMNVLVAIRSRLAELEPVAALWSRSRTSVSLEDWARGSFVLVMASNETCSLVAGCFESRDLSPHRGHSSESEGIGQPSVLVLP